MNLKSPQVHVYRLELLLNRFGLTVILERNATRKRRTPQIPLLMPCHGCAGVLDARMRMSDTEYGLYALEGAWASATGDYFALLVDWLDEQPWLCGTCVLLLP